jgi:cephalosporin hydroxylase
MLTIDEARGEVTVFGPDGRRAVHPMDTAEAFEVLSAAWLRSGRDVKYAYGFTWMGRPVIRMPEDMIRIQELIWRVRPDVILETGIGHGGSLVFYATLFAAMGHGRVIGVDPDIEPHNRVALGAHPLAARISLIEGTRSRRCEA